VSEQQEGKVKHSGRIMMVLLTHALAYVNPHIARLLREHTLCNTINTCVSCHKSNRSSVDINNSQGYDYSVSVDPLFQATCSLNIPLDSVQLSGGCASGRATHDTSRGRDTSGAHERRSRRRDGRHLVVGLVVGGRGVRGDTCADCSGRLVDEVTSSVDSGSGVGLDGSTGRGGEVTRSVRSGDSMGLDGGSGRGGEAACGAGSGDDVGLHCGSGRADNVACSGKVGLDGGMSSIHMRLDSGMSSVKVWLDCSSSSAGGSVDMGLDGSLSLRCDRCGGVVCGGGSVLHRLGDVCLKQDQWIVLER
jgi:hypothetical protein